MARRVSSRAFFGLHSGRTEHFPRRVLFAAREIGLCGFDLKQQSRQRLRDGVVHFAGQSAALLHHGEAALLFHLLRNGNAQRGHVGETPETATVPGG